VIGLGQSGSGAAALQIVPCKKDLDSTVEYAKRFEWGASSKGKEMGELGRGRLLNAG
jgi:hypothetical protein